MPKSPRDRKKPVRRGQIRKRDRGRERKGGAAFRLQDVERILRETATVAANVFGGGHPFHLRAVKQLTAYLRRVGRDEEAGAISRIFEGPRTRPPNTLWNRRPASRPPAGWNVPAPAARPALLDIRQAARYLTVSPETLYKLVRSGEIPHVRVGKSIRFRSDDIERFLDERTTRSWVRVDRRGRPRLQR